METQKVGKIEKLIIGSTYRLFQRLNPFAYYYEPKITEEVKKCKDDNYIIVDSHWHDFFSDGDSSPEHMVDVAHRRGIFAGGCANHGTTEHWDYYREAEKKYEDFVFIPSVELSTNQGDLVLHFRSYGCKDSECVKELVDGKKFNMDYVIEKAHEAGGIVIVPHPNKNRGIGLRNLEKYRDSVDGVEEINAGAGDNNVLGRTMKLPSDSGSDAHSKMNVAIAVTKVPKSYFKDCFGESGVVDKDKFRDCYIDYWLNEKVLVKETDDQTAKPCLNLRSSFHENIEKTTYSNVFQNMLRATEYFLDNHKVVAKRLAACLKRD